MKVGGSRSSGFHLEEQETMESQSGGFWVEEQVADKGQSLNKTCSVELNQYFIC